MRKPHREKTLSKKEKKNASVEKGIGDETEDLTMMYWMVK
jgi:hypothetical protein